MNIIIAGDFCPRFRVKELLDGGLFSTAFSQPKDVLLASDYSIINLECPIQFDENLPIKKNGPNLSCSGKSLDALKWMGFKCVTLANNHLLDYGEDGVKQTIESCIKKGIDFVGGGENLTEASKTLYKEVSGCKLAIINCCEHEFSIASAHSAGSNPIDPISQYYAIREAKDKADLCIVIVHGGIEHYQLPTPRLHAFCHYLVDIGADAVICHHQHCYSGFEKYNESPIFYGLGNFCFDGNRAEGNSTWHEGYMVKLIIEDRTISGYELIPYVQCEDKPGVFFMEGERRSLFFSTIYRLNNLISNPVELSHKYDDIVNIFAPVYEDVIAPYNSRLFVSLRRRGLLPSFFSEKRLLRLKNYINCESHRDCFIKVIEKLIG